MVEVMKKMKAPEVEVIMEAVMAKEVVSKEGN